MIWPFQHKSERNYWLKAFALYALAEACIQLLFLIVLNNFGQRQISIIEFHLVMWIFQCLLIWPIWWLAWKFRQKNLAIQILANTAFYIIYTYLWFGPVQDAIGFIYYSTIGFTRTPPNRLEAYLDRGYEYSYLNYQLLKHAFRLSWFFLAAYFYNYRQEEGRRLELAVANRELQLRLLKWHLNPSFYFKTISYLKIIAAEKPVNSVDPILQLAKVMEYVIYEAKEKLINVKKEINFLNNYTRLINQQSGNNLFFEIKLSGEYDKLKISPLLLAAFIDRIAAAGNAAEKKHYLLQLQFSGREMLLLVNADAGKPGNLALLVDESLLQRLEELYHGRFSASCLNNNTQFNLALKLDEER